MSSSTLFASQNISASEAERTPRFGKLLTSVLGSPFLTTADLPADHDAPNGATGTNANGEVEMEDVDGTFAAVPRALTVTRPASPTPSFRTESYSIINWDSATLATVYGSGERTPRCSSAFLSSSRRTIAGYPSYSPPSASPLKCSRSLGMGIIPRIWDALREGSPGKRCKRRSALPSVSSWREASWAIDTCDDDEDLDYANMLPLDGEEGELIDDEACFIDVRAVTGVDIVALLPPELALHLLSFLDLPAILACLRVSRTWNRLAEDNSIWCMLFSEREVDGWRVDLRRANPSPPAPLLASKTLMPAPLEIDWYATYRTRTELDRRWSISHRANASANPSFTLASDSPVWEPRVRRISGHRDSVYCLEFDSSRIITGSRDLTIKVWSLKTGRCLGSFAGHRGSVLCLKFDKDWDTCEDREDEASDADEDEDAAPLMRKGFMVSGSSDCSVCVWELSVMPPLDDESQGEQPVMAEVKAVLKGHSGGVLDLRIDSRWIVSCSKDALIRVWDRKTLALHCTLRGHEGPVNAVGLQGNRVVSASGDGKMMLWDIATGQRLRTFEGHDRGLACIEFKDDLIVSGSNDCKIKVWSAATGACLRTLVGHEMLVRALSFDPRSGRLVSGSYDKTVKVWDLHTGRMLREFRGCHESHIFDVKFDHCRIVSTSHDQHIIILDFSEGLDVSLFI